MNTQNALILGKWLAALAWADGKVDKLERKVLSDFCNSQSSLSKMDCLSITLYLEYSLDSEELANILYLANQEYSDELFKELISYWQDRMSSTGNVEDERKILLIQKMQKYEWDSSSRAINGCNLNREKQLDTFLNNPVFYRLIWNLPHVIERVDKTSLEIASLEFALIARVAQADEILHDGEKEVILDILSVSMDLEHHELSSVFDIALRIENEIFSTQRIVQRYAECTSVSERKTFLELLLEVIIADGEVHPCEKDILIDIAKNLGVSQVNLKSGLERIEKAVQSARSDSQ